MSVLLETSVGDLVIDLEVDACPKTCENFLKLCKVYYYNLHAFFNGTYISCSDANPDALLPLSLQGLFGTSWRSHSNWYRRRVNMVSHCVTILFQRVCTSVFLPRATSKAQAYV